MNEQALGLQAYIERRNLSQMVETREMSGEESGMMITISSGKGGVGKSTLILNLGLVSGEKTLIVDGDFLLGNLVTMMGERSLVSWGDIFTHRATWRDGLISLGNDTDVLAGVPFQSEDRLNSQVTTQALSQLMKEWKQAYDLIFVDTAGGLGMRVIEWSLAADHVILVTTPDPTACTNNYALIKALHLSQQLSNIGMIVNQYLGDEDPWTTYKHLALMVTELLNHELLYYGGLPWIQEAAISTRNQVPLLLSNQGGEWRSAFREILANLVEESPGTRNSLKKIG